MIKRIFHRIKSDFFLKDRISEYEQILKLAIESGYKIMSHSEYFNKVKSQDYENEKILIIRQDIDSDPTYAHKWLELQKKYNVHSSMYFRKCTFDKKAMIAVHNSGSDCGYHYEEIADFVKKHKLFDKQEIQGKYPEIRQLFHENLTDMESKVGFKIQYIASHGDFANRKVGLLNHEFVTPELLLENGLLFEAYQEEFTKTYHVNISDCGYPRFYKSDFTPQQAMQNNIQIIHFLMHPKHWRSSWKWNIYENSKRIIEGLKYRK